MIDARGNTSLPEQFCKSCEYLSCLLTVSCGLWVNLKSYCIGGAGPSEPAPTSAPSILHGALAGAGSLWPVRQGSNFCDHV
jgi:hypothetical protein